jgi:hypothetical protein
VRAYQQAAVTAMQPWDGYVAQYGPKLAKLPQGATSFNWLFSRCLYACFWQPCHGLWSNSATRPDDNIAENESRRPILISA